jgi:hypothetical protein
MGAKKKRPLHNSTELESSMEDSIASLHAKLDALSGLASLAPKIESLEKTIQQLVSDNAAYRDELKKKDEIISTLTEKVNRLDQTLRATSLRIHGLPLDSNTPAVEVPNIVYNEIIILIKAKACGDLSDDYVPSLHSTLANAFTIPSKKNTTSPVVVKFHSEIIRSLVFKHKQDALPTIPDPTSNRIRPKYSIYEDLTSANHTLLRSFSDDSRVKSAWTFNGQVRFKTHINDTVYRVNSSSDTFEKLVKPPTSSINPSNSSPTPLLSSS